MNILLFISQIDLLIFFKKIIIPGLENIYYDIHIEEYSDRNAVDFFHTSNSRTEGSLDDGLQTPNFSVCTYMCACACTRAHTRTKGKLKYQTRIS